MRVELRDGRICAEMPALLALARVFRPMWLLSGARVEGDEVCWRPPRGVREAYVRVGRGREAEYYHIVVTDGVVKRMRMRFTKKLGGGWMLCGRNARGEVVCVEFSGDGIVLRASRP